VVFNSEAFHVGAVPGAAARHMAADRSNAAILCITDTDLWQRWDRRGTLLARARAIYLEHNTTTANKWRAPVPDHLADLRVFGERRDGLDPFPGRDPCNVNFIKGGDPGIYTLTLNIWDMKCCVDYLETRPRWIRTALA